MITETDRELVAWCIGEILSRGASAARVTLNRSIEDLAATLNGEIDKVTRCEDSSLYLDIFTDGRYGSFSTNRTDKKALGPFISKAVEMAGAMEKDPCRKLPAPGRKASDALTGLETGLYDAGRLAVKPEERLKKALDACLWGKAKCPAGMKLISEEGEYSDSVNDNYVADSEGLSCAHTETSFDYGVEMTVEDEEGNKYSAYGWDSSPFESGLDSRKAAQNALEAACAKGGSAPAAGGRYTLVVDREVSSRLVTPLLGALNGYSVQQENSFLKGTLGNRVFNEGVTILDIARTKGMQGAKYFDSEGVATENSPIIENGVVKEYFLNTYMAEKTGLAPTVESATKVKMMPWPQSGPGLARDRAALLRRCRSGIIVTDFNGGNCNPATGDFSYGIEGFLFEDGEIVRPVDGMLITGNMLELWKNFLAAADDARPCQSRLIPSLAFASVDFSGE